MSSNNKEMQMEEGALTPPPKDVSPMSKDGDDEEENIPPPISSSSDLLDEPGPAPLRKKLTLRDLKRARHVETEAETSILKGVEAGQEETGDDGIFQGVPEDLLEGAASKPPRKSPRACTDHKKKQPPVNYAATKNAGWMEAVGLLTEQLETMQDKAEHAENKGSKRHHHVSKKDASIKSTDSLSPVNPADRWGLIRQAVYDTEEFPSTIASGAEHSSASRSMFSSSEVAPDDDEDSSGDKRGCHPWLFCVTFCHNVRIVANLSNEFFKTRIKDSKKYYRRALSAIVLALAIACILFYGFDNPGGVGDKASVSWWLLFAIRQIITFSMARASQIIVIELMCLQTRWMLNLTGPVITLLVVLSKGWPYLLFSWGVFDLCLIYGDHAFADHWLYYQDPIEMCNAANPSGGVPGSDIYGRLIACGMITGVAVAIKRLMLAKHFGQQTSERYGSQLSEIIGNMVLIGEVASLSRVLEEKSHDIFDGFDTPTEDSPEFSFSWESFVQSSTKTHDAPAEGDVDKNKSKYHISDLVSSALLSSQKISLKDLLDEWEEPEVIRREKNNASMKDIFLFKRAIGSTSVQYPFTLAFGPATTRAQCIDSSVEVYERLLSAKKTEDEQVVLSFDVICTIALDGDGELDKDKARTLVRLFRPDRNGDLSEITFVQACDSVYKSLRLLQAAVANSSQIDHAFEVIFNCIFYLVLGCIILAILGTDPFAIIVGFSGILVGFAFMIGSASAKYFEGVLFILVRRPYDIGDRIAVSNIEKDTSSDGSSSWFVEGVNLFTTTVRYATTNEVATYSNGSLSDSRIINAARSPKAIVYINLKVDSDIPYETVDSFRKTIERFVKARPREWLGMTGFRATRAEADLGYIEYSITLQHKESWQNFIAILQSKAELSSHCAEVQNEMDMKYIAPPLPVNLKIDGRESNRETGSLDELLEDATGPSESKKTK